VGLRLTPSINCKKKHNPSYYSVGKAKGRLRHTTAFGACPSNSVTAHMIRLSLVTRRLLNLASYVLHIATSCIGSVVNNVPIQISGNKSHKCKVVSPTLLPPIPSKYRWPFTELQNPTNRGRLAPSLKPNRCRRCGCAVSPSVCRGNTLLPAVAPHVFSMTLKPVRRSVATCMRRSRGLCTRRCDQPW